MKRSGPPARRTELARGGGLRRSPMKRGKSKRRAAFDAEFVEVRDQVLARDGYRCQRHPEMPHRCLGELHVHHIKPRSRGGDNDPWNLISLCPVHHQWVHEHPTLAIGYGLLA